MASSEGEEVAWNMQLESILWFGYDVSAEIAPSCLSKQREDSQLNPSFKTRILHDFDTEDWSIWRIGLALNAQSKIDADLPERDRYNEVKLSGEYTWHQKGTAKTAYLVSIQAEVMNGKYYSLIPIYVLVNLMQTREICIGKRRVIEQYRLISQSCPVSGKDSWMGRKSRALTQRLTTSISHFEQASRTARRWDMESGEMMKETLTRNELSNGSKDEIMDIRARWRTESRCAED